MTETMPNKHSSKQPVAVVTGAGRGIGRALVETLRERDYLVVAVVRTLSDVSDLFSNDPHGILPIRCDVTEPSTESILHEFLSRQISKVDLLINNAGFGATGYGISGLKFDELDRVFSSSLLWADSLRKGMSSVLAGIEKATILNISSRFASLEWVATGTVPSDQATYAYRIGKAAMNMFTSCLSVELGAENIRVLAVDPGKVKTRFGPKDADTEPHDAARAILSLAEAGEQTGLFVHSSGEKLPW